MFIFPIRLIVGLLSRVVDRTPCLRQLFQVNFPIHFTTISVTYRSGL
jgi:hypothetical protein